MTDPCKNKHGGADTSVMAWKNARQGAKRLREQVYAMILNSEAGLTADEIAESLDVGVNSVSGRFTELKRDKRIFDTGARRKTRSGNWARVYCAEIGQLRLIG